MWWGSNEKPRGCEIVSFTHPTGGSACRHTAAKEQPPLVRPLMRPSTSAGRSGTRTNSLPDQARHSIRSSRTGSKHTQETRNAIRYRFICCRPNGAFTTLWDHGTDHISSSSGASARRSRRFVSSLFFIEPSPQGSDGQGVSKG